MYCTYNRIQYSFIYQLHWTKQILLNFRMPVFNLYPIPSPTIHVDSQSDRTHSYVISPITEAYLVQFTLGHNRWRCHTESSVKEYLFINMKVMLLKFYNRMFKNYHNFIKAKYNFQTYIYYFKRFIIRNYLTIPLDRHYFWCQNDRLVLIFILVFLKGSTAVCATSRSHCFCQTPVWHIRSDVPGWQSLLTEWLDMLLHVEMLSIQWSLAPNTTCPKLNNTPPSKTGQKSKFWGHFIFSNFKSCRNKSDLRIQIFHWDFGQFWRMGVLFNLWQVVVITVHVLVNLLSLVAYQRM